ncbi:hypothetical protein JG29_02850 [Bombilactobacillus mellis]|uniref:Ppx/GppA phosphatase N-terminal domain-containing protein n=1 Tax=Bombilactobacillus mellis TaxID=1218508 RepID=A0A0F4KXB4_9LACO|nr:hypothetical protein [Bombilactobacillus mellis]KJY51237.1 hypothetical protein JG29_02850 [Bombilactobacillus mellis]
MAKLALIDIGSNSIRMVLYQIDNQYQAQEITRYRHFVQLAKDMTAAGAINQLNFAAGIQTLQQFHQIIIEQQVTKVIATATEAIRKASNQSEFLQAAQVQAQIKIQVLTGQQEAYYDALAIQTHLNLSDFLFLDTGGGSFEWGWRSSRGLQAASWPYGAVKLYDELHKPQQLSLTLIEQLQQYLFKYMRKIQPSDRLNLVVIGGVHNTLFTVMQQATDHWLPVEQVDSWVKLIEHNSLTQNLKLENMEMQRAPFMAVGLLPLSTVLNYFSIAQICFSKVGLRNGILWEYLQQAALKEEES